MAKDETIVIEVKWELCLSRLQEVKCVTWRRSVCVPVPRWQQFAEPDSLPTGPTEEEAVLRALLPGNQLRAPPLWVGGGNKTPSPTVLHHLCLPPIYYCHFQISRLFLFLFFKAAHFIILFCNMNKNSDCSVMKTKKVMNLYFKILCNKFSLFC